MFTAYHKDDWLFSHDGLDAVLAFVAEINEPQFNEDVTVWQGHRVIAVCLSGGRVVRFDGAPPAPPAAPEVPADLACLDEAAA